MNSRPQDQLRICPRCKKSTKRIEVEVEGNDWGKIWLLGFWAAFFPDTDRAFVCEHCGNLFERRDVRSRTKNQMIGFFLLAFSLTVVLAVVILLAWGMLKHR